MESLVLCDDCNFERVADLARRYSLGMEAQSFYDPSFLQNNPDAVEKHLGAMSGIHLRSVHGPFGDLNPGSFDPMVREVARNRFEMGYEIAEKLGAQHLVLHLGYVPKTSPVTRWVNRCINFWNDFMNSKPSDISIHIENMLELNPQILGDVISGIDHTSVDICLDVGHVHANTRGSVLTWIELLGPSIGYVHLHDNHGETDEHLGLGQGTIATSAICEALKERSPKAIWAVEAEGEGLEQSLKWLESKNYIKLA